MTLETANSCWSPASSHSAGRVRSVDTSVILKPRTWSALRNPLYRKRLNRVCPFPVFFLETVSVPACACLLPTSEAINNTLHAAPKLSREAKQRPQNWEPSLAREPYTKQQQRHRGRPASDA